MRTWGTWEVFRKELADQLSSKRCLLFFSIVYIIGFSMAYESFGNIRKGIERTGGESVFLQLFTTQAGVVPSFLGFIAYFGPLISLILVFDVVNQEISRGTLGNVLSQPVHRDSVINGKFLAAVATVSLIMTGALVLITGVGIMTFGTLPTFDEWLRMGVFLSVSVVFLSLWVALGLLFSILFKREGTSMLASITIWIFFSIFIYMITDVLASANLPTLAVSRLSPLFLYTEAAYVILVPEMRILGPVTYEKVFGMLPNPLPIDQSLLLIWPHLISLTAVMVLIFALSYVIFVRLEIRST